MKFALRGHRKIEVSLLNGIQIQTAGSLGVRDFHIRATNDKTKGFRTDERKCEIYSVVETTFVEENTDTETSVFVKVKRHRAIHV